MPDTWDKLNRRIESCTRCRRLRAHGERVAREKRKAFADWDYWAGPVPNFGDPAARLLIVGLAPAAHGANRTGRMFTGDRSGDFLFDALHRTGFASQPVATGRGDGLTLTDCAITAAAHCAPPANKPTREELSNCSTHLHDTFALLADLRVIVALGRIGHDETLRYFKQRGVVRALSDHAFTHGATHTIGSANRDPRSAITLIDSFHPSQQNTFTGRLTMGMLVDVFRRARRAIG